MRLLKLPVTCLIAGFAGIFALQGCGDSAETSDSQAIDSTAVVENPTTEEPTNMIHGMPSALHHSDYLLIGEEAFDASLTAPAAAGETIGSDFGKALLFGMYQADLGYIIAHDEQDAAMDYLEEIKKLGDELGLFDEEDDNFIEDAEKHIHDKGKLHNFFMKEMKETELYLAEQEGKLQADLVAAGVWIENTYLATQILKKSHDDKLMTRVGEDKLILPRLIEDLETHQDNDDAKTLVSRLKKAEKVYAKIEINHEDGEAMTDTASGVTHITTEHSVGFSQKRLAVITKIIAAIRNGYLKPQAS